MNTFHFLQPAWTLPCRSCTSDIVQFPCCPDRKQTRNKTRTGQNSLVLIFWPPFSHALLFPSLIVLSLFFITPRLNLTKLCGRRFIDSCQSQKLNTEPL